MIYWDSETGLIQSALLAPPLACITWTDDTWDDADIVHGNDPAAKRIAEDILTNQHLAANTAYDLAVFGAKWPDLLPLIFESLEQSKSHDLILLEKLCDIGDGCYRIHEIEGAGEGEPGFRSVRYGLSDIHERYVGTPLEKDKYRLGYGKLRHHALATWEPGAVLYPKKDTLVLRTLLRMQQQKRRRVPYAEYVVDEPQQSRAAFAYHLTSCWGVCTDTAEVRRYLAQLGREQAVRRERLIEERLVREDGSRDTKAALALMKSVMGNRCALTPKGTEIYRAWWKSMREARIKITPEMRVEAKQRILAKGFVSLAADVCLASGNKVLTEYGLYGQHQLLISKVKALDTGGMPVQTSFETLLETGRASSFASKIIPNSAAILNLPRAVGMRECFVPRNWQPYIPPEYRHVFLAADYGMAELVALGQICIWMFGESRLADALNAGNDPHLTLAAAFAGIPYERAQMLFAAGDAQITEYRTMSKVFNFGVPGLLGEESFVAFAAKVYKYSFADTLEESLAKVAMYKRMYFERFPEVQAYHNRIREMCDRSVDGKITIRQFVSNRLRGFVPMPAACNGFFQSLTADAMRAAYFELQRRCYVGERIGVAAHRKTALYGARIIAPVHDEFVTDVREAIAHEAAEEKVRVMVDIYRRYTPDVRIGVEAVMMRRWSKKAKPVRDASGRLIPFEDRQLVAA